jgi:hypothetical protein
MSWRTKQLQVRHLNTILPGYVNEATSCLDDVDADDVFASLNVLDDSELLESDKQPLTDCIKAQLRIFRESLVKKLEMTIKKNPRLLDVIVEQAVGDDVKREHLNMEKIRTLRRNQICNDFLNRVTPDATSRVNLDTLIAEIVLGRTTVSGMREDIRKSAISIMSSMYDMTGVLTPTEYYETHLEKYALISSAIKLLLDKQISVVEHEVTMNDKTGTERMRYYVLNGYRVNGDSVSNESI